MNSKERILAVLNGEKPDRVPVCEIGVWPETEERWRSEGLGEKESVEDHFGLDPIHLFSYDPSLMLPKKVIEEDETSIVCTDGDGCKYRMWKNIQSPPQFLGSTISDQSQWDVHKHLLVPKLSRFEDYQTYFVFGTPLKEPQITTYERAKAADEFTVISPTEACWYYLRLLGEEDALCSFMTDPDFVKQLLSDYNTFTLKMLDIIWEAGYRFDAMWVFSDMCYKNGMLFSPAVFKEIIAPFQKDLFGWAKERGMKVIYHSDGYVGELIPLLIEVGVDCVQPLEARAGNDVREYLKLYADRLSFIGNINADVLSTDQDSIYNEIYPKFSEAKKTNRYIYHSDHSIPYTISYENYKYSIELAKELGK